ncbi:MAG: PQQ-binding-like beta-propeller repeat protein [Anaerolineales bacterium]|nr:PQQ-binding-like beta-propeller repeat protein [Anaerolineales bacterium]
MADDNFIRKIKCPACGAPLEWAEAGTSTTCAYCKVRLERNLPEKKAEDEEPEPAVFVIDQEIQQDIGRVDAQAARKASRTAGLVVGFSLLFPLALLLLILLFEPSSPVSLNPHPLLIHDPVLLIDRGEDGVNDIVAVTYDRRKENYALARLSMTDRKILWRGDGIDSSNDINVLANGERVLVTVENETQLKGYHLEDGKFLWESTLVDKLGYAKTSLSVYGNSVVTISQDFTLQVFDITTGEEIWNRRLAKYVQKFSLSGNAIILVDEVEGEGLLFVLDIADGSVKQTISPACENSEQHGWTNQLSTSSKAIISADGSTIDFIYGNSPACVERWDLLSGKLLWKSIGAEQFVSRIEDEAVLVTPEYVFFPIDELLWQASPEMENWMTFYQAEDYELEPLLAASNILVVRAKRTRGSERFELWGLDLITGNQQWTYYLGESQPFDPPGSGVGSLSDGESAWTWMQSGDEMILVTANSSPTELVTTVLDISTGKSHTMETTGFDTWNEDSYWAKPINWQGSTLWLLADQKILVIDAISGKIAYSYP